MVTCQQIQKKVKSSYTIHLINTYNHSAQLCSSCQVYHHHLISHCNVCVKFELNDKPSKSVFSMYTVHCTLPNTYILVWYIDYLFINIFHQYLKKKKT